jgi:F-type H+-transporting ATPase subunit delta
MDIGVISMRYARALLKGSTDAKVEEQVYQEMQTLAESYVQVPELRKTIDNPMIEKSTKTALLEAAAGGKVSDMTRNFIKLILDEGREKMTQFMANSYLTLYRQQKNIISGKLTTAVPVSSDMEKKMQKMVESRTNGTVEFSTEVNPEILGGFILEYDTYRLDTSVKSQLKNILKELS